MIELPKDREGREIPLDTEVLYDNNGVKFNVDEFKLCALPSSRTSFWTIRGVFEDEEEKCNFLPHLLHLVQPDSWEKLYGDIDKCVVENSICMYCSKDGTCKSCALRNASSACSPKVLGDILDRIRKLRGEGE